jgi:hypothetical protein
VVFWGFICCFKHLAEVAYRTDRIDSSQSENSKQQKQIVSESPKILQWSCVMLDTSKPHSYIIQLVLSYISIH